LKEGNGYVFKYKLGDWVLSIEECAFTNIMDLGKNKTMHQYLIESIDNWVNKTEPLIMVQVSHS